ncbi:hypothetical protein [Mycobacterium sp. 852013-50091_SCH5140682]|nr:hypothetical protein [Mycobacterium sp. 852013-50091_SCH5140682]
MMVDVFNLIHPIGRSHQDASAKPATIRRLQKGDGRIASTICW